MRLGIVALLAGLMWSCVGDVPPPDEEPLEQEPVCATSPPCRVASFDHQAGNCTNRAAEDGAACDGGVDRAAGSCLQGRCVASVSSEECRAACAAGCWPGSVTAPLWTYRLP